MARRSVYGEDFGRPDLRRSREGEGWRAARATVLSLAAFRDGMNALRRRCSAPWTGRRCRDWVHRFNPHGPDGLIDFKPIGRPPKLSSSKRRLKQLVSRPERKEGRLSRAGLLDLNAFSDSASVSTCRNELGARGSEARRLAHQALPRAPVQTERRGFLKNFPARVTEVVSSSPGDIDRSRFSMTIRFVRRTSWSLNGQRKGSRPRSQDSA